MSDKNINNIVFNKFSKELANAHEPSLTLSSDKRGFVRIKVETPLGSRKYEIYNGDDHLLIPYYLYVGTGSVAGVIVKMQLLLDVTCHFDLARQDVATQPDEVFWAILQPFIRFSRLSHELSSSASEVNEIINKLHQKDNS